MNNVSISISDMELAISKLASLNNKVVLIAGASASGKSYFAKQLDTALNKAGKSTILLGSDNYYSNESALKYLLYGTFDHPNLIDYPKLQKDIQSYIKTGSITHPIYSFIEKRTVDTNTITQDADYIIVEGLYTISQLAPQLKCSTIFVDSSKEELVFRRLIRDQERVAEPMHTIIENLGKVFPMRNIYGDAQRKKADITIFNDYAILDHKGTKCDNCLIAEMPKKLGEMTIEKKVFSFLYSDIDPDNGDIIVSEVYYGDHDLLRYVQISKVKEDANNDEQTIDIKLYQPGILTAIHTLLQTAGIPFIKQESSIERTYKIDNTEKTYIKKNGTIIEKRRHTKQ